MDYQAAEFWLACASFLMSAGAMITAIVAWWGNRNRVTQDAINRVEKHADDNLDALERSVSGSLNDHASRLTRMETQIGAKLDTNDLNTALRPLYDLVNLSAKQEAALAQKVEDIRHTLATLTNAIMEKGLNR